MVGVPEAFWGVTDVFAVIAEYQTLCVWVSVTWEAGWGLEGRLNSSCQLISRVKQCTIIVINGSR
jgi:hypothetical protein